MRWNIRISRVVAQGIVQEGISLQIWFALFQILSYLTSARDMPAVCEVDHLIKLTNLLQFLKVHQIQGMGKHWKNWTKAGS